MHIVDIHIGDIKIHAYMLVIESLENWDDAGRGLIFAYVKSNKNI